jgi:outer membrane protein assembly factor BamE (lipoprotein component of BamABCDE complex)
MRHGRGIAGVVAITLSLLFGGCAGRDFVRPAADSLTLGTTTEEQIRARLGSPYREGTLVKNGVTVKTLSYAYAATTGTPMVAGVTPARALGFYFDKGVLVGHEFTSSYRDDHTDYDESKVPQIRQGETTRAAVVALMGPPHAAYLYPLAKAQGQRAIGYLYSQTAGSPFALRFYQKTLVVSYDANDVVTDVNFVSTGQK